MVLIGFLSKHSEGEIKMGDKAERAKALFLEGYNCTQAVVGAFAEEIGMDFDTAVRLASGFGGGMGRLRQGCRAA